MGQTFGRLTVIDFAFIKNSVTYFKCICTCGNETIVRGTCLRSGRTVSCGCRKNETAHENCFKPTHGMKGTRIYHTWRDIKDRCTNSHKEGYKNYGGRGIKVCDDWFNSFESFYDWAMAHGYNDDLTIERIDVNGDYCPENCTWATRAEQSYNKRNNIKLTYKGETHNLKEWEEITGIKASILRGRYQNKWDVERILTQKPICRNQ